MNERISTETDPSPLSPLGQAALELARNGFAVFPLKPWSKAPPLTRRGCKDATTDERQVRAWWTRHPLANVGLVTGGPLTVLDVDPRSGGDPRIVDALRLPGTLTARTGGGGWHFLYYVSERVRCSTGVLAPGVDVKGKGGYIVAAPSVLEGGGAYRWEEPVRPIAHIDAAVLRVSHEPARNARERQPGQRATPFQPRERVAEGGRHAELTRWAGWLRSQGYEAAEIESILHAVNAEFKPPIEDSEEVTAVADWAGALPS